jgi:hypothetical protein
LCNRGDENKENLVKNDNDDKFEQESFKIEEGCNDKRV